MEMIEIQNVSKFFRHRVPQQNKLKAIFFPRQASFQALENINLRISQGEIFALLGPNGAGKTTLIKIVCGLLSSTTGKVYIEGQPIEYARQKIGLMLGFSMIYYRLTGYDNLKYFAKLYRIKNVSARIEDLAVMLGLEEWMDEYVENYSNGMKSKLALARALIHDPDILILDEPTAGLDPLVAKDIRNRIKALGKTLLLTTHNMAEAQNMASKIALLHHGKIRIQGSLADIQKTMPNLEDVFIHFAGNGQ